MSFAYMILAIRLSHVDIEIFYLSAPRFEFLPFEFIYGYPLI
jgi:hypothetical protein